MTDLPHNLNAEKSVLGAMMMDATAAFEACSRLDESDFAAEQHKVIFAAMRKMHDEGRKIDYLTVDDELSVTDKMERAGGDGYIMEVSTFLPSALHVDEYIEIIKRDSTYRKLNKRALLLENATRLGEVPPDEIISELLAEIGNINGTRRDKRRVLSINGMYIVGMNYLENDHDSLIKSGWPRLDKVCPVMLGDYVIIGASTGVGKTAFATSIGRGLEANGHVGLMESAEMGEEQMSLRFMSQDSLIPLYCLRTKKVLTDQFNKLIKAANAHETKNGGGGFNVICDPNASPKSIEMDCKEFMAHSRLDFLIIDYLQFLTPDRDMRNKSREQEVASMSRFFAKLSKELGIAIFALCQLNGDPDKRDDHRPRMEDIRESKGITHDADSVWMLYREGYYDDKDEQYVPKDETSAELLIRKNRGGPAPVKVNMEWDSETASYREKK